MSKEKFEIAYVSNLGMILLFFAQILQRCSAVWGEQVIIFLLKKSKLSPRIDVCC